MAHELSGRLICFSDSQSSSFTLTANFAGSFESGFLTVFLYGHRSLPLFSLGSYPTDFVAIQFIVQSHPNHSGTGIAYRHHVLVGPDFSQLPFDLIAP